MRFNTGWLTLIMLFTVSGTIRADVDLIFADDFESGTLIAWSGSVGYIPVPIIDLRADVNRNGVVDLTDPTEDQDEDTWDAAHGAIFLANIDDDESTCPTFGPDPMLAACNDSVDDVVNGPGDLLDLARLEVVPWLEAPSDAAATIALSIPGASFVRLFRRSGADFVHFDPAVDTLTSSDLRDGVELAIEAVDIVRSASTWDGFVDVTLDVDAGTVPTGPLPDGSDTVRLRVAPVIFRHHLDPAETIYVSSFNDPSSVAFRADLATAATAAGVAAPLYEFWDLGDQWTQDFFETSIMSMPAVGGAHTIHVNFRSANYNTSLRTAGRVVFTVLRGPDVAGAVQFDPNHPNSMDTLNSFGNLETLPPYDDGRTSWPLGRVVRGGTPTFYPDQSFDEMVDAQGVQPVIYFDTEWLWVGHIDETMSFLPVSSPRGWLVLAADVVTAWNELAAAQSAGYGNVPMFVGQLDPWGTPAEITISEALADPDLYTANAWAAAEVAGQLDQLTVETGITPSEIISAPFLMFDYTGYLVAWVPGLVNGMVLPDMVYAPPDPHGPVIGSVDLFKGLLEAELATAGYSAAWVEDWDLYHIHGGEVHCGSNATHALPDQPWWEALP